MEPLVSFTRCDAGVDIQLESVFPCRFCAKLDESQLRPLGRKLCFTARRLRRRFVWRTEAKAPWGVFTLVVKGRRTGTGIQLTLIHELYHKKFKSVSDCDSIYTDLSNEAVLDFGKQLKAFKKGGNACLYGGASINDNPFYDEYDKSRGQ